MVLFSACENEEYAEIPFQFVELEINLTNQDYLPLQQVNGYVELEDVGVRGIILYRESMNNILAFERNCTFEPRSECATVIVNESGLFMEDTCCGSHFDFMGFPAQGPARVPLVQYSTTISNNFLYVRNGHMR